MLDTGKNVPESVETLLLQQKLLREGRRAVQMFPRGTNELPLPKGMKRIVNSRGIFHYNPEMIEEIRILEKSREGKENEFLCLGPFSKEDILKRLEAGEQLCVISENTEEGIEVRSAWGTDKTIADQLFFFEATKDAGNILVLGKLPDRLKGFGGEHGT